MPASSGLLTITGTGRQAIALDKLNNDNVGEVALAAGGSWTLTATFQGNPFTAAQDPGNNGWQNCPGVRTDTLAIENTPTLTGNTARSWKVDIGPFQQLALNVTAITGTLTAMLASYRDPQGIQLQLQSGSTASQGTTTMTSSSAAALAVGPSGATNPSFNVDASTGSAVNGLNVKSSASGNGVALSVISSGTNEPLTVDAKGSGAMVLGAVSTGLVIAGRGSTKVIVTSGTKTTIATQNSTPTAAQLLGGYISHNSTTGAGTATLDTGANIDTALVGGTLAVGDTFTCQYANIGSQTVTITTNTGLTLKGTVAVPSGKNAVLTFFRTGSATYDVICNVSA